MAFKLKDLVRGFLREGGKSKLEIVEFAPVEKSSLTHTTQIQMIASVGGKHPNGERWELVGGRQYLVSPALADKLIVNGWAMGTLSRVWSKDEIEAERAKNQPIIPGGM